MATLSGLPEELISNIAARLHVDDMAAFRLTSRLIEQKSFHEFATEYFTEKCFMFITDSLQVLANIAGSERLRAYLHRVHFMTALFSENAFGCPRGCSCAWQPSMKQKEAYRYYVNDQKALIKTGHGKQMLLDAFSKLTSLQSLSIDDSMALVRPDVDCRGGNKVPRLTGRPPMMAPHPDSLEDAKEYSMFFKHVWQAVMQALENSSSFTRLGTHLHKTSNSLSVKHLDVTKFPQSVPAFKTLQMLLLRIRSTTHEEYAARKKPQNATARDMQRLAKFGEALPSLQILDLTFDSTRATGPYFLAIASGINLSKITTLYLDGVDIDVDPFAMAVDTLRSIKSLRLMFVNLWRGTWHPILKLLQGMTGHLQHLDLMYLLEAGRKVFLLKQLDDDLSDCYSEENDTDDDLPPLEHMVPGDLRADVPPIRNRGCKRRADSVPSIHHPSKYHLLESAASFTGSGEGPSSKLHSHSDPDHVRPADPNTGERGYYVCVQGSEIAAQLPTFIEQYNTGENVYKYDEGPVPIPVFPAGIPPTDFNDFVNILGAAFGVQQPPAAAAGNGAAPPAPPPPPPSPPSNNAGPGAGVNGTSGGIPPPAGTGGYVGYGPFPPMPPAAAGPAPPPLPSTSAFRGLSSRGRSFGRPRGGARGSASAGASTRSGGSGAASAARAALLDVLRRAESDEWEDYEVDGMD